MYECTVAYLLCHVWQIARGARVCAHIGALVRPGGVLLSVFVALGVLFSVQVCPFNFQSLDCTL